MNRKEFLKNVGLLSAASALPASNILSKENSALLGGGACTIIPTETEGPFPLDLTSNTYYFRKDIRETQTGVPLHVKLKIIGLANCLPLANVRVNIWHCSKDGLYSGYDGNNNKGQLGLTYLRGYQITDANGEVNFVTVFPGWYGGRIAHIHFKVSVSTSYAAVSQLTWDIAKKNALYSENKSLYTKGDDPETFISDNIFSDGHLLQLASLDKNLDGSYSSYLEVAVQGTGATGIGHIEKENAKNFSLGQNYPNPVEKNTTIPFQLRIPSQVKIDLWNEQGELVKEICNTKLSAGNHSIEINFDKLQLAQANYAYQITVQNENGIFVDSKLITVIK
ncbi:MAG: hypothetical protein WAS56_02705 [Saprospiraceae bacterium]|nr:hypothetical protein [Saprospiraceae bacterium]MBK9995006.1 hypothetical protein [Saprospiraceae bacterium]